MSHKDGRVVLSAWVEPVLRDYAREAARLSGMEFSRWVERAVRRDNGPRVSGQNYGRCA